MGVFCFKSSIALFHMFGCSLMSHCCCFFCSMILNSPLSSLFNSFLVLPQYSFVFFFFVPQIAFYEQVKQLLLSTGYFKDNIITHFSSSIVAVSLIHVRSSTLTFY